MFVYYTDHVNVASGLIRHEIPIESFLHMINCGILEGVVAVRQETCLKHY